MKIEKIVNGGQGLAHTDDLTVFVWNALPGEEVEVQYLSKRKGIAEAVATKILTPSPDRIEPKEEFFLSSSPWQIVTPAAEDVLKQTIAVETYGRNGGLILQAEPPTIISDQPTRLGIATKLNLVFVKKMAKCRSHFLVAAPKCAMP